MRNTQPQSGAIYYTNLEVHNSVGPFTRQGKLHEFGAGTPIS
jgi:hypothetical protein